MIVTDTPELQAACRADPGKFRLVILSGDDAWPQGDHDTAEEAQYWADFNNHTKGDTTLHFAVFNDEGELLEGDDNKLVVAS